MSQDLRRDVNWRARNAPVSPPAGRDCTVIVPLDGSAHAAAALPVARAMADIAGTTLHIVYVGERVLPPRDLLHKLGLTTEQLHRSIIHQGGGAPAASVARLASSFRNSIIVICTRTWTARPAGKLGLGVKEVLQLASCPVLLVHPRWAGQRWMLQRVLLPHDGVPSTATAISTAADLARQAGAELIVLHVAASSGGGPLEPGTFTSPRYVDQPQHEWPAWASEFLGRLCSLGHTPLETGMRVFLETGEPGATIVRFAAEHDVDLIVLGWRGRMESKRAATIKAVIGEAHCPVMLARIQEPLTN
ncbi:MAG: universal stress protein [Bacteroidetes bacterium]|nr:universal stress protein [Bacteroidota bacterium]MCL5026806.1 universal stress protein [Chloroflexota bacterium]